MLLACSLFVLNPATLGWTLVIGTCHHVFPSSAPVCCQHYRESCDDLARCHLLGITCSLGIYTFLGVGYGRYKNPPREVRLR